MDDREVVAAIAAGNPAGMAALYDKYAAGLYDYCHWILPRQTDAAEALRDALVSVATTPEDLPEAPEELRPWLYSVARGECLRRRGNRLAAEEAARPGQDRRAEPNDATITFRAVDQPAQPTDAPMPIDATVPFRALTQPAGQAPQPADATVIFPAITQAANAADGATDRDDASWQAELRTLIRPILAELKPREREVIELHLRHDLSDADLAIALGTSWSHAHALSARACGRLEKALGALLVARTGREACPALAELLTDGDGHLTQETRELVDGHIDKCESCAGHRQGALRPAALSSLLPLAPLPAGLREQVLRRSSPGTSAALDDQQRTTRRARFGRRARPAEATRPPRRSILGAHPGPAVAALVVVAWVVAAVSVTILTFVGLHPARALPTQPDAGRSSGSAKAATAPAVVSSSAIAKPSPTLSSHRTVTPPPVQSSPAFVPPPSSSPSRSPRPSRSPSKSPSPSPSPSPSASPSPSPSPSLSPSPTG